MNIFLVIIIMSMLSFSIALYLVTLVFTQSHRITMRLLHAETVSFFKPKNKINIFKDSLNKKVKRDLQRISSTSNKKLQIEYKDLSIDEIKEIKTIATLTLQKKIDIVSFEDTKKTMKEDGYLNFFTSYQRFLDFYVNPNHQIELFNMDRVSNRKKITYKQWLIKQYKNINNTDQQFLDTKIFTLDHTQKIVNTLLFKNSSNTNNTKLA